MLTFHKATIALAAAIAFGIFGGPQAMAGSPRAGSTIVLDTNGKIVGPFAYIPDQDSPIGYGALVSVVGQTFYLPIFADTGFASTIFTLSYTSSDCTGQPYTSETPAFLVQPGKVANGLMYYVYYVDFKTDEPITFTGQGSLQTFNTGGGSSCAVQRGLFGKAYPALTFDLSTLGFTAPFSVQLR
jgi:hypothetical protein